MIAKDENLLVKVVKKSLGLPTGGNSCSCGAPAAKANECCSADATESTSQDCGCGATESQGQEPPEQA